MRAWPYLYIPRVSLNCHVGLAEGNVAYLTFQSVSYPRCKGAAAGHRRQ